MRRKRTAQIEEVFENHCELFEFLYLLSLLPKLINYVITREFCFTRKHFTGKVTAGFHFAGFPSDWEHASISLFITNNAYVALIVMIFVVGLNPLSANTFPLTGKRK